MKKFFIFILSVIMIFSCVACGNDNNEEETPTGVINLKLWTPISGADATIFNRLITKFNTQYNGAINVAHQSEVRENHYKNIKNNVPSTGPDMAILHSQLVQNYAANGYIVPIDSSFFTKESISTDDYLEKVMDTLYYENKMYGVPLDVHPIVLYYNKSLVGSNALPTNYSELIALAKKLTQGTVYGLPVSTMWPSEFLFTTALYQNGGQEITAQSDPLFNSAAGEAAAQVLRDLIHKDQVSPNNLQADQDLNLFTSGKAAFHIQGSWSLFALKEALGDDLGAMSMSNMFAKSSNSANNDVMARSHVFTVTKTKKAMSSRKKEAITTFIKWMGENSAEWSEAGQIPAYTKAYESDTYKNSEFLPNFGDPENFRTPASAVYFESGYERVFEYITTIMKDNTSDAAIKTTLATAETEAKKAVKSEKDI